MEIIFDKVNFIIDTYTPLEKTILNSASFEIHEKGIYSFIGPSNSGKTSIGDLMTMLVKPNSGKVIVNGYVNNGKRVKKIKEFRKEIGYIFKNPYDMFFNKTVKKELEFAMKNYKYKKDYRTTRIKNVLKLVSLSESILEVDPFRLNITDAKKLALACILTYNPSIIVLDEFSNGLSKSDKDEITRLLKLLKNKYDKTIILLTKDTSFAYGLTDYVYLLDKTRIITHGNKELLRDVKLIKSLNLEVPRIVSFIDEYKKKNKDFYDYTTIMELLKAVYRDVF